MATILIVEDESDTRRFLSALIVSRGHQPVEAEDAQEGLALFHAQRPDLVITDIVMPAMDGFEFIRKLRADRIGSCVPVIIHTGHSYDQQAFVFLARECGVQIILKKPSRVSTISEAMDTCLNSPRAVIESTAPAEDFERKHLVLLNNTLAEKVRQLETTNRRLEQEMAERLRSERALQENHALLHTVVESIPEAVFVKDRDGRYLLLNSSGARIVGKTVGETIGRHDGELFAAETARHFSESDHRVMESGLAETMEQIVTVGGVTTISLTTKAPFRSPLGEMLGVVGIARDVTERKQAEDKLRDYSARFHSLSRQLVEAQEAERCRIARELHDELGQLLAAMNYKLHMAHGLAGPEARPWLEKCSAILQQACGNIRDLALELRPALLDVLGLEAALHYLAERHRERTGQDVQVQYQLVSAQAAPAEVQTALLQLEYERSITCFRIVQEALANSGRYSQARRVKVELKRDEMGVELVIQDDGVGFDVALATQLAQQNKTFGLLGMKERANLLGGRLDIESAPGLGTKLHVLLPISLPSAKK